MNRLARKKRRVLGIVSLLVLMGIGAYGFYIYDSNNKIETVQQPTKQQEAKTEPVENADLHAKSPYSVLLLGVDEREGDKGRSDTMIVMTINPNDNSMKMVSIPRDTKTEIVGYGKDDKINHAYAFGGEQMSVATVENFLDIPIHYYVKMNMDGFKNIVDAVGGVTVDNSLEFSAGGHQFSEGQIDLDGEQALSYVRMRKQDPDGDFGRQQRQIDVLKGVIQKRDNVNPLTMLEAIGTNIRTNLQITDILDLQKDYKDFQDNIDRLELAGKSERINNIYYQIVPEDEKLVVQAELKEHLGLN